MIRPFVVLTSLFFLLATNVHAEPTMPRGTEPAPPPTTITMTPMAPTPPSGGPNATPNSCKTFKIFNKVSNVGCGVDQDAGSCTITSGAVEDPSNWQGIVETVSEDLTMLEACQKIAETLRERTPPLANKCSRVFLGGHVGTTWEGLSVSGLNFSIECNDNGVETSPRSPEWETFISCLKEIMADDAEINIASCGGTGRDPITPSRLNHRQCAASQLANQLGHPVSSSNGECSSVPGGYSYCINGQTRVEPLRLDVLGLPTAPVCLEAAN